MSDTKMSIKPSMWRNAPIRFGVLMLLTIVGVVLVVAGQGQADHGVKNGVALIGAIIGGLPVLGLLRWYVRCLGTRLIVADNRVTLRRGILSRRTNEIRLADIRNITVDQSTLQRLFGVGTIGISSAAQSGVEIMVEGIPHPQEVADRIRGFGN
jgi:uncharacterized membrane protein YdbT with pleckstrin-like domain